MSKPKTVAPKPVSENPFLPKYAIPDLEGFQDQSGELVGYWNPEECYIRCIPREVNLFDNKIDEKKPSALIVVELTEAILLDSKEENEAPVMAKPGDMAGVWYSPGMRGIINLGGEEVLLAPNGLKDVGKPSDMKLYIVRSRKKGYQLPIARDSRKQSLSVRTDFDVVQRTGQKPAIPGPALPENNGQEYF